MARDIPGTNGNYLSVPDGGPTDITGTALTVSCRVFSDVTSGDRFAISKAGSAAGQVQYDLRLSSNKVVFRIGDGAGEDSVTGATNIGATAWRHICGVKNGTGAGALLAYLDGAQDGSATSNKSIQNRAEACAFGARAGDGTLTWDGRIAEIAIWNVALSAAEVAALAKGVSPLLIRRANLKAYLPLFGVAYPEADLSGNVNATQTGTVAAATAHAPVGRLAPFAV